MGGHYKMYKILRDKSQKKKPLNLNSFAQLCRLCMYKRLTERTMRAYCEFKQSYSICWY